MIVDLIPVNIKAGIIALSRYKELHLISYFKSINADNINHELLPIYYYNKYLTMKIIHKEKYLILSNEALDQYHQELDLAMKTKSLYLRPNLCLDDLSNETGIPIEYVKQIFSEKLNLSFFEYVSKYKIDQAKQLLTKINDDHFSISRIAIESGFNTDDSFVILFKKHTNMSPENYRIKYFNLNPDSNIPIKD